jgi:hypothetical protein
MNTSMNSQEFFDSASQIFSVNDEMVRNLGYVTIVVLIGAFIWSFVGLIIVPMMQAIIRKLQSICFYVYTFIRVKLMSKRLVLKQPVTLDGILQMNNETGEFFYLCKMGERDVRVVPNVLAPYGKEVFRKEAPIKEIALLGSELSPLQGDSNNISIKGVVALRNEEVLVGMGCRLKYGMRTVLLTANHVWEALPVTFVVHAGAKVVAVNKVDCEVVVRAHSGSVTKGGLDTVCVVIPAGTWAGLGVSCLKYGNVTQSEPFNLYGFNNLGQFCKVTGQRVLTPTDRAFVLRHQGTTLPGMSGSPLLNLKGEVVAIHTGRDVDGESNVAIALWFTKLLSTFESSLSTNSIYSYNNMYDKYIGHEDVYVDGKVYELSGSTRYYDYKEKSGGNPKLWRDFPPLLDAWDEDDSSSLPEVPVFESKQVVQPVLEVKPVVQPVFENKIAPIPNIVPRPVLPGFRLREVSAAPVKTNITVGVETKSPSPKRLRKLKKLVSSKSLVAQSTPLKQVSPRKRSKPGSLVTPRATQTVAFHSGDGLHSTLYPSANPSQLTPELHVNPSHSRPGYGSLGRETTVLVPMLSRKEWKFYNKLIRTRAFHAIYKAETPERQHKMLKLAMHCATSCSTVLRNEASQGTLTVSLEWIMRSLSEQVLTSSSPSF